MIVFTSGMYAQVTAGAVLTSEGAVIIDTLPFPSETRQIIEFVSKRSPNGIRHVILTHYHADHTYGAYLFRNSEIISHALCRDWLVQHGQAGLEASRAHTPDLAEVQLHIPNVVFENGEMTLREVIVFDVTNHLTYTTTDEMASPGTTYTKREPLGAFITTAIVFGDGWFGFNASALGRVYHWVALGD